MMTAIFYFYDTQTEFLDIFLKTSDS